MAAPHAHVTSSCADVLCLAKAHFASSNERQREYWDRRRRFGDRLFNHAHHVPHRLPLHSRLSRRDRRERHTNFSWYGVALAVVVVGAATPPSVVYDAPAPPQN